MEAELIICCSIIVTLCHKGVTGETHCWWYPLVTSQNSDNVLFDTIDSPLHHLYQSDSRAGHLSQPVGCQGPWRRARGQAGGWSTWPQLSGIHWIIGGFVPARGSQDCQKIHKNVSEPSQFIVWWSKNSLVSPTDWKEKDQKKLYSSIESSNRSSI